MKFDILPLEKADISLKNGIAQFQAVADSGNLKDMVRDGVIQRFEYTFELSWKMIKRYLEMCVPEKIDEMSSKDMFRRGMETGLITDSVKWFVFRAARNKTSRTYDKKAAKLVYNAAAEFLPHAGKSL
jgi:nucleotidyltransferase substrate binding protein (TIGR01987 family)